MSDVEGPPTAGAMQAVMRDLLDLGEFKRAEDLAEVMLDYWQNAAPDRDSTSALITFGWWLGMQSAAVELEHAKNRRQLDRIRSRTRRSA